MNQLKQIGLAYRLWSNDHNDEFPFASTSSDGSRAYANTPQVFRHYLAMSNELVTPKILVRSTDVARKSPPSSPNGFVDFSRLANTNLSYFVGLDASEADPAQILSGDRNVTGGTFTAGFLRVLTPKTPAGWANDIHVGAGNVGLADGGVQQFSAVKLSQHLASMTNVTIRLAIP